MCLYIIYYIKYYPIPTVNLKEDVNHHVGSEWFPECLPDPRNDMGKGYSVGRGDTKAPGEVERMDGWEIASRGDAAEDFWATRSNHGYHSGVGSSGGGNNHTSPG